MPVSLSLDTANELAKETLMLVRCEWDGCRSALNSWQSLREHQHHHCHGTPKTQYECQLKKCSARFHSTRKDLINHIDASHMSRVPIPCPVNGCPETFIRHTYLTSHLQTIHDPVDCQPLKQTRSVFAPLPSKPPPLPTRSVPIFNHPQLPVRPSSRHWISRITQQRPKDVPDNLQLEDLPLVDHEDDLLEELIIRPGVNEAFLQLAAPQSIMTTPPSNDPPPQTIGYDVFGLRLDDLKSKGVLPDGSSPEL